MVIRVAFDRMDASVSLYFGACKPRLRHLASCRYLSIHLSYHLSIYRRCRCLLIEHFLREKKKERSTKRDNMSFNDKRMQREFSRFKRCEVEQGFILYRIGHSFLASSRDQCGRCETFGTSRSRPPRPSDLSLTRIQSCRSVVRHIPSRVNLRYKSTPATTNRTFPSLIPNISKER